MYAKTLKLLENTIDRKKTRKDENLDLETVIRVQALVRGFLERRRHRVKKIMFKPNVYFTKGDQMETLTRDQAYKMDAQ